MLMSVVHLGNQGSGLPPRFKDGNPGAQFPPRSRYKPAGGVKAQCPPSPAAAAPMPAGKAGISIAATTDSVQMRDRA
jgi:hypothetical protein